MEACWSSWVPCSLTPWWWGWRSGSRCLTMSLIGSERWGHNILDSTPMLPAFGQTLWSMFFRRDSMGLMLCLLGTCPISLRRANWPRCSFFTQILTSKKQNTSNQKIMNNRWKINLISKVEDYQSFSISWVCLCSGSRWKSLHCHRRRRPLWVDD